MTYPTITKGRYNLPLINENVPLTATSTQLNNSVLWSHQQNTDIGTTSQTFHLFKDNDGVILKSANNVLEVLSGGNLGNIKANKVVTENIEYINKDVVNVGDSYLRLNSLTIASSNNTTAGLINNLVSQPVAINIVSITQSNLTVKVSNEPTFLSVGDLFVIVDSQRNNGIYKVLSITQNGSEWDIVIDNVATEVGVRTVLLDEGSGGKINEFKGAALINNTLGKWLITDVLVDGAYGVFREITTVNGVQTIENKSLVDSNNVIINETDNTKKAKFNAGNITAGETRVYNLPDKSGTIALLDDISGTTNKFGTEIKVIDNNDVTNGYIEIDKALDNDIVVHWNGIYCIRSVNYDLSEVSGKTRITFQFPLEVNDVVAVYYRKA